MKHGVMLTLIVGLVLLIAATGFSQEDQPELDLLIERWTQALNTEDIEAFLDCYWNDAIRIIYFPDGESTLTDGIAELRAAEEESFDQIDFISMNLVYATPRRYFPRGGRATYIYPNDALGFMDVFEFEKRRGQFRIIKQYLLPHPVEE